MDFGFGVKKSINSYQRQGFGVLGLGFGVWGFGFVTWMQRRPLMTGFGV